MGTVNVNGGREVLNPLCHVVEGKQHTEASGEAAQTCKYDTTDLPVPTIKEGAEEEGRRG